MNKKNIKKELENEILSNEIENKIDSPLINYSYLNREQEDIEDDDNDDDISEKDKVTEDILNNKLSIIIPYENENNQEEISTNISTDKIQKDIIKNLLIDLFDYHYNDIIGKKKINPRNKIKFVKNQIEFYYDELNINFINFAKFIILILEQKIDELIEYIKKKINMDKIVVKDILEIKKSLHLVGDDINKIFELPFEKTREFDISSVLEILFISNILHDSDIDINEKEYEEIADIAKLEEKDNFEKYTEECKSYFEKIENGEKEEEDVEVEEEKNNEKDDEIINTKKENKNIKIKINVNIDEDILNEKKNNILKEQIQFNKISIENNEKNIEDKNINKSNNIIEKNESLTVEDLLKYINANDKKKKKKKKRRKKKKEKINEEHKNNNNEIDQIDEEFENFKSYIMEFSARLDKSQKIKPNISQAFLDKLM